MRALGFSPRLPVSVCGTGTNHLSLRGFSWPCGIGCFGTYISLPITSRAFAAGRICLSCTLQAWTRFSSRALSLPSGVTPSQLVGGRGISTPCPSLTPFGLSLGPGLPWADEPSPGILRLTASRILTCFFAYSCRHSHFCTLHHSLRYGFAAYRTLPYPQHSTRYSHNLKGSSFLTEEYTLSLTLYEH